MLTGTEGFTLAARGHKSKTVWSTQAALSHQLRATEKVGDTKPEEAN